MNIAKKTEITVSLTPTEVEEILLEHVKQRLHSNNFVHRLADGEMKDHVVDRFSTHPINGFTVHVVEKDEE